MSKQGFSVSDLHQGAKSLAPTSAKAESSSSSHSSDDSDALRSLGLIIHLNIIIIIIPLIIDNSIVIMNIEDLYNKYDGDLDLM
jgi:hypothetical protein